MDMTGEYRIAAPRQTVWEALNDPEILKQCIPGCEELDKTSPTSFTAKVVMRVGPVKATFTGAVTLSELNPPISYKISGEGKGGAAGFAKGGAEVALDSIDANTTLLRYKAQANVGGKLAQIGSRLIEGTAKKISDEFFGGFANLVSAAAPETAAAAAAPQHAAATVPNSGAPRATPTAQSGTALLGLPPVAWIGLVVLIVIVLLIIFAT